MYGIVKIGGAAISNITEVYRKLMDLKGRVSPPPYHKPMTEMSWAFCFMFINDGMFKNIIQFYWPQWY